MQQFYCKKEGVIEQNRKLIFPLLGKSYYFQALKKTKLICRLLKIKLSKKPITAP
jgi:hypothetical protein